MTKIRSVGQISITVHDLSRAVGFYRDVLELPIVENEWDGVFHVWGRTPYAQYPRKA